MDVSIGLIASNAEAVIIFLLNIYQEKKIRKAN
jgi:hypothetical protein